MRRREAKQLAQQARSDPRQRKRDARLAAIVGDYQSTLEVAMMMTAAALDEPGDLGGAFPGANYGRNWC